jgi:hypothetical protein
MATKKGTTSTIADQVDDIREQFDNLGELPTQFEKNYGRIKDRVQSKLEALKISANTIPDTFERAPKFISPTVHAWLDAIVTGYFIGVGAWCIARGKKGAATAAFVNAGMVAGVSLMTDYHGTGDKPINFKLHGTLDAVQATTAALGPVLHGFADEPESAFFYGQALNEVAVIAATDWDEGMAGSSSSRAA